MSTELPHSEQSLAFIIESDSIPYRQDDLPVPIELNRESSPASDRSAEQSHSRNRESRSVSSNRLSPPLSSTVASDEAGVPPRQGYARIGVWSYELFCGLLALLSFVAIIVVAHAYSGDSLPDFPYGLSINAILAIFTAIIKASIALVVSEGLSHLKWVQLEKPQLMSTFNIYDQASRGPFGAGVLLGKFGWRLRHTVSSVGAVVLVLLVPIDPLAQQIVQFYNCQRHATTVPATIPRARIFDMSIDGLFFDFYGAEENYGRTMEHAISQVIFNPGQNQPFWSCATGNCSFTEVFSSLGYCSSCVDAWDRVVGLSVNESQWFEFPEIDTAGWGRNISTIWTLPGFQNNSTISKGDIRYEPPPLGPDFAVKNDSELIAARGITGMHFDNGFAIAVDRPFTAGASDPTTYINFIRDRGDQRGELPQHAAFSCSFSPCVRTYHASDVKRDKLEEVVDPFEQSKWGWVEEWSGATYAYWAIADLHCLGDREYEKSVLRGIGYEFQESTRWLPYNMSFQYHPGSYFPGQWFQKNMPIDTIAPDAQKYYEKWIAPDDWLDEVAFPGDQYILNQTAREIIPKECIYQFSAGVQYELQQEFSRFFESGNEDNRNSNPSLSAILQAGSGKSTLADMQELMEGVADSLTAYIRSHAKEEISPQIQGSTLENSICIRVRWAWITYLAGIIAFFLAFFVALLVSSRRTQARMVKSNNHSTFHDFKSSALPLLLCGLDPDIVGHCDQAAGNGASRTKELEKISKKLRIELDPTEKGWKIALAQSEVQVPESGMRGRSLSSETLNSDVSRGRESA